MGNENKSTKARLLEILRQSDKRISGEELATALSISRTSVWKGMQALQNSGYIIDAQKSGYILSKKSPDSLCAFEFGKNEKNFVHFHKVGSTMVEARKLALKGIEENQKTQKVVTADEQSAGQGRGDHIWKTTNGSLAFTLVTYPKLFCQQSGRTLMAAQIALANVLEKSAGRQFFVRWPNDIWSDKGKVAGILDEGLFVGGACSYLNLGIGVNLSQSPKITGTDKIFVKDNLFSRKEILESFLDEYSKLNHLIFDQTNSLQKLWDKKNFDSKKSVRASDGKKYIFEKIDENGWAIMSETKNGAVKKFAPGSVSYEKR